MMDREMDGVDTNWMDIARKDVAETPEWENLMVRVQQHTLVVMQRHKISKFFSDLPQDNQDLIMDEVWKDIKEEENYAAFVKRLSGHIDKEMTAQLDKAIRNPKTYIPARNPQSATSGHNAQTSMTKIDILMEMASSGACKILNTSDTKNSKAPEASMNDNGMLLPSILVGRPLVGPLRFHTWRRYLRHPSASEAYKSVSSTRKFEFISPLDREITDMCQTTLGLPAILEFENFSQKLVFVMKSVISYWHVTSIDKFTVKSTSSNREADDRRKSMGITTKNWKMPPSSVFKLLVPILLVWSDHVVETPELVTMLVEALFAFLQKSRPILRDSHIFRESESSKEKMESARSQRLKSESNPSAEKDFASWHSFAWEVCSLLKDTDQEYYDRLIAATESTHSVAYSSIKEGVIVDGDQDVEADPGSTSPDSSIVEFQLLQSLVGNIIDDLYVGTMSIEVVKWIWDQGLMAGFTSSLPKICAAHLLVLKPILVKEHTIEDMRLAICDHSCRIDLDTIQWAVQENFLKSIRTEMGLPEVLPAMIPTMEKVSTDLHETDQEVERAISTSNAPSSRTETPVLPSRASSAKSVLSITTPPGTATEQKSEDEADSGDNEGDGEDTSSMKSENPEHEQQNKDGSEAETKNEGDQPSLLSEPEARPPTPIEDMMVGRRDGVMVVVGDGEKPEPLNIKLGGVDTKLEWPMIYKSVDQTEEVVEGILDHTVNQEALDSLSMNRGRIFSELVFEVEEVVPWLGLEDGALLPTVKLSLQGRGLLLRIPYTGESEESILSRIRFCAKRNEFDSKDVDIASQKLLEMLLNDAKTMREKGVELIDRVAIAKKKEIERRKREEEEQARQEAIAKAKMKETFFAESTKDFAKALHSIFCGVGEIGRGDKAQVVATRHYVKAETEAMEMDFQAAHKKVYKKHFKKEEIEAMRPKVKEKYDKKAPKFKSELAKLEHKRRKEHWAMKQHQLLQESK